MAAVVAFPRWQTILTSRLKLLTQSLQDAVNTVVATLQAAVPIARIELLDEVFNTGLSYYGQICQVQMAACNQYSKLGLPESPTLFIEFHGTHAGVAEQVEAQAPVHLRSGGGGERCGQGEPGRRVQLGGEGGGQKQVEGGEN